jgi:hypothetical protein
VAEHVDLLRRFRPQLEYDSNEAFFADSAAEWTDNPGNVLRRYGPQGEPGQALAAAIPEHGQDKLDLEFLAHPAYGNGAPCRDGDAISDPSRDYWDQYWFFYFYNDYNLAGGIGLHEGDWETVQLRMHGASPDLAVYAQHRWAERKPWGDVDRLEGSLDTPLVYVARGSHASYFRPGYHETEAP